MNTITKNISIHGYLFADRLLEDCFFYTTATLDEKGLVTLTPLTITNSTRSYLEGLGAPGSADHWIGQAKEWADERWACEELGEVMNDAEYEQWEDVLLGDMTIVWLVEQASQ